ncbi:MAG: pyridoxal-phosphate dependent enzyme [Nitrososphaerota archaeon]
MFKVLCSRCGSAQEREDHWRCTRCGYPYRIIFDEPFNPAEIVSTDHSLWRYKRFIAVAPHDEIVTMGEGYTPLIKTKRPQLYAKLEYIMPTGSYKDRGSTVLITSVKHLIDGERYREVSIESSGNAGSSVAAYAARAGIKCTVYTYASIKEGKARQMEAYGAKVVKLKGDVTVVSKAAQTAAHSLYVSHAWNPYFQEGTKTIAYEIAEQRRWTAPDFVFVPTSAGSLILGVINGFKHLYSSGVIDAIPTIVAVQPVEVSPVYHALMNKPYTPPEQLTTIADALISTKPIRLQEMVDSLREIKGSAEIVEDYEIIESHRELAAEGLYVEPSSAASHAAYLKWMRDGKIKQGEDVVILLTGSGLKIA